MLFKNIQFNTCKFMIQIIMQMLCAGILLLSLMGCSKTKEMVAVVLKDRGEAYTQVKTYPNLRVPKGIALDSTNNTYRIPEGSSHGS